VVASQTPGVEGVSATMYGTVLLYGWVVIEYAVETSEAEE
jgi:hypothetical protein